VRTTSATVDTSPIIYQKKIMHTTHKQTAPTRGRLAYLKNCGLRIPEVEAALAAERAAHAKTKAEVARYRSVIAHCERLKAMIDAKAEAKPAPASFEASQPLHGRARAAAAINAKFAGVRH